MAISYSMPFGVRAGAALIVVVGCSGREGQAAEWQEHTRNGKTMLAKGGDFQIANVQPAVKEVLDITGFSNILHLV